MRSDVMKKGLERAPHRSLFKAMGYTNEELSRPLIGIAHAHNEIIPGHIHLDKIVDAVKAGARLAGGTPVSFATIGICDGIAMNHVGMKYSLGSREPVVSDSAADALRDTRETYRIVVAGVVATDIGGELRPVVGSLPGLLLDLLQGYDRRFVPPAEQDAMRERIIRDALRTVERDLARQQEQRARAALSSRTDEALQERIAVLGEDRAALRNADRDRIAVASVKPVVYPEQDFQTFTELRYPQRLPGMFDADMVLYLTVEPVEPYLLVHIFATDRAGGEVHEVSRFVALPDELATALEAVSDEVRTYVIGSSFASVSVRVTDPSGAGVPDAEIFIDAKLAGRGDAYQTTLTPGEHAILVRSGRGAIRRTSIMVEPGGFRIVVVRMPAAGGGTIRIESEPDGAEVYHGVEWAGSTPLEIPRPDTVVQYALRSDGYLESRFVAGPDTPGDGNQNARRGCVRLGSGFYPEPEPVLPVTRVFSGLARRARYSERPLSGSFRALSHRERSGRSYRRREVRLRRPRKYDLLRLLFQPRLERGVLWQYDMEPDAIHSGRTGVSRTMKKTLGARIRNLFGLSAGSDEFFEELEDVLIEADLGAALTMELTDSLRSSGRFRTREQLVAALQALLLGTINRTVLALDPDRLNVFLLLGVNGVGKTTNLAKLARHYSPTVGGERIVLAAGDTFRAAAVEQLSTHAQRLGMRIVKQKSGSDAAAGFSGSSNSARCG